MALTSEKKADDYVQKKLKKGIQFKENRNLSESEIDLRFKSISEKYEVNELLSDEDAEFVIFYSTVNRENISSTNDENGLSSRYIPVGQSTPFDFSKSLYGLDARFKGSFNFKQVGSFNNFSYSINSSSSCSNSHLKSISIKLGCDVYGIAGTSGLAKAYSGSISSNSRTTPGTLYYSDSEPTGFILGFIGAYLYPSSTYSTQNGSSFKLPN